MQILGFSLDRGPLVGHLTTAQFAVLLLLPIFPKQQPQQQSGAAHCQSRAATVAGSPPLPERRCVNDLAVLLAYAAGALVIGGVVVFGALWIIRNDLEGR